MREPKRYPLPYLHGWRLHKRMSQAQLAEKAKVGKNTVVRLERQDTDEKANELTIYKLAGALEISPTQLREEKAPDKGAAA